MPETLLNPPLRDDLTTRLASLAAVARADGVVQPYDAAEAAAGLAPLWDLVIDGVADLLVVVDDEGAPLSFAVLAESAAGPRGRHRSVIRLLVTAESSVPDADDAEAQLVADVLAQADRRDRGLVSITVVDGSRAASRLQALGFHRVADLPSWVHDGDGPVDGILLVHAGASPPRWLSPGPPPGLRVPIRQLDPDLPLPAYARPGDAGLDLRARRDAVLTPGTRLVMPTGIAVAIPEGYVGLVHPRSGLAVRSGLSIVNSPGTIDAGYRGELMVPLINLDPSARIVLRRGDRIAQLLVQAVVRADLAVVDELPDGVRGTSGFGSTGR